MTCPRRDGRTQAAVRYMYGSRVESHLRDGGNGRVQRGDAVASVVVNRSGGDGLVRTIDSGVFGGW